MGFLDSISSGINRGAVAAERAAKTLKLRNQMSDLMRQRQGLAAQLGASLYEGTKGDPSLRSGREALYDSIALIDEQRISVQTEIDRVEAEAAAEAATSRTYVCDQCSSVVSASDMFCSGCGKPVAEIKADASRVTADAPAVTSVEVASSLPGQDEGAAGSKV